MLTGLTVRNFKRFEQVHVELGSPVVFIGPNNSGKTTAMQALMLWRDGLALWQAKYESQPAPERRHGVTVNRRDLVSIPVPTARALWHRQRVRGLVGQHGARRTGNVRIDVVVSGVSEGASWRCGLEFEYANQESIYCRPLRVDSANPTNRMAVPAAVSKIRIAFLPPMSGLAATESRLDRGAIDVRIGEGRTAEVLRNLCYLVHSDRPDRWDGVTGWILDLFGSELEAPEYVPHRGEVRLSYREGGTRFDLSCTGRGLQQTLLLLAYMYANPGAVLLLDEPDAHLEVQRQRQTYNLLSEVASEQRSQIIAASHSEVLLNEAARRDTVIAFVAEPHGLGGSKGQVAKALKEIGFEHYLQAQQTGWVLYLEGSTDLAILRAFAERVQNARATRALAQPFVHYVGNQPQAARRHFHGIREAVPALLGMALFDRLQRDTPDDERLELLTWRRREIESYLCTRGTLEAFARSSAMREVPGALLGAAEAESRSVAMASAVSEIEGALLALGKGSPWSADIKAGDEVLEPLFKNYYRRLGLPNPMAKKSFYELARHIPVDDIDDEVKNKLDAIARVAETAIGNLS